MNYNTLQSLLPNDEIHYIDDCDQFFADNNLDQSSFSDHTFILFEYTIQCLPETIEALAANNIKFTRLTDEFDLDYIII